MNLNDDYLDSRELEERIDELLDDDERDKDEEKELIILKKVKEECEGMGWEYGITFIQDYIFKDYAQELAEDCEMTSGTETWPLNCIDWDKAAKELQWDYSLVTIDGRGFWYREA